MKKPVLQEQITQLKSWLGDADVHDGSLTHVKVGVLMTADLIDRHFRQDMKRAVVYDVSAIPCQGCKIKGFGGVASGPAPLIELIQDVNDLFERRWVSAPSVDCTDIANLIGKLFLVVYAVLRLKLRLGMPMMPSLR